MAKKAALILLSSMLLVFFLSVIGGNGIESVVRGYTDPVFPAAWQKAIVRGSEQEPLSLLVDGERVDTETEEAYLTNERKVMLPLSWIRRAFPVSSVLSEDRILLLYGKRTIEIFPERDEIILDGETRSCFGEIRILSGVPYLSSGLLSELFGIESSYLADQSLVSFETHGNGKDLPERYFLGDLQKLPKVQDQKDLGACVAFASLSALESFLLPEEGRTFSRDHMLLSDSFEADENGGEPSRALAYLLSGQGPVSSESDPYGDGKTVNGSKALYSVKGAVQLEHPDTEALKMAVFRYGGVEATMYLSMADSERLSESAADYNENKAAYCSLEAREVNHDVVIVGWDDSFSKGNFPCGDQLHRDGAFICLNSWGEDFGENGLFYVSYEDASFAQYAMAYSSVEKKEAKERIYQTDLVGPTAGAGYENGNAWFANIYTAKENEVLAAAGFYTLGERSDADIYVVHHAAGPENFTERELLSSVRITDAGYHTVSFKEEIPLEKGERFAILVHLNTEGVSYPVAVENIEDGDAGSKEESFGYLGVSGSDFKRSEKNGSCRVCLKAYTRIR